MSCSSFIHNPLLHWCPVDVVLQCGTGAAFYITLWLNLSILLGLCVLALTLAGIFVMI